MAYTNKETHLDMDKMRDNAFKTFKLDGNGFGLKEELDVSKIE